MPGTATSSIRLASPLSPPATGLLPSMIKGGWCSADRVSGCLPQQARQEVEHGADESRGRYRHQPRDHDVAGNAPSYGREPAYGTDPDDAARNRVRRGDRYAEPRGGEQGSRAAGLGAPPLHRGQMG